jgi:plasmid stabilization system protein ParE
MTPIQWTETARADLRAIHAYVARDSRVYARRLVDRIRKSVGRLRRFPESGARVLEWDRPDVREVLAGNYRVIYRLRNNTVQVLTVIHGARLLSDQAEDYF